MKKEEFFKLIIFSSIFVLSSLFFGAKDEIFLYLSLSFFGCVFVYLFTDVNLIIGSILLAYLLVLYLTGYKSFLDLHNFFLLLSLIFPSFLLITKNYFKV